MKTIFRNLAYVLRRFKMAILLNILGLSVAFAAFIIIMMQVDYDHSFDAFHKDVDQIYRINMVMEGQAQACFPRPMAEMIFEMPQIQTGTITHAYSQKRTFSVNTNGQIFDFQEFVDNVGEGFTDVFHFEMLDGTDKALAEPMNVLMPESMARKVFGDESALGKQLKVNDYYAITVGGVYKDFPKNSSIHNFIYMAIDKNENKGNWDNWNYNAYIKIDKPHELNYISETIKTKLEKIGFGNIDKMDLTFTSLKDLHYTTDIMYDNTPKANKQTTMVLFAIAFIIVVIAAVNFNNFNMALAPIRIKSINTRKVLGASVGELRMRLISEGIILSIIAYLIGLLLVYSASYTPIAAFLDVTIDLRRYVPLVSLTALLALLTGAISGLYPSYYVTSFQPAVVLNGSFGQSIKGRKLRNLLIGIQFVASFVLFVTASFMYLQNRYLHSIPLGYDKDQLIIVDLNEKLKDQANVFNSSLKSFAGIEGIAFAESLLSSSDEYMGWGREYKGRSIKFNCLPVDPSFLQLMGIEVVEGRDFREDDKRTRNGKYIFNEKAKSTYEIELNSMIDSSEIIGFIPDIKFTTLRITPTPMAFYVWGTQNWGNNMNFAYIKVKGGSDMRLAMDHVKNTLKIIDSKSVFNVRFYDDVLNSVYQKEKKLTQLITLFSIIAILISIIGVFGLVIFENEYRQKEISIRKVVGSSVLEVLILFNKSYSIVLFICFLIACPIAYYTVNKWLENFAFHTPIYWWVFPLAGLVLFVITIATVSWQSWQTATSNPVDKLKNE